MTVKLQVTRNRAAAAVVSVLMGFSVVSAVADQVVPLVERPMSERLGFLAHREQVQAYMGMEKVYPTKVIEAGGKVRELPVSKSPIGDDFKFVFENRPYTVDDLMAITLASGLIIVKDGEVVLEKYGLGRTPNDRWTSFSVVKPLTSTLVGAAIKDGFIDSVDDPLDKYIPELKGGVFEGVTLKNAMRMDSGVGWYEAYDDPISDFNNEATNVGPKWFKFMSGLARIATQGTRYSYSTGDTNLVGAAVQRATGKGLAEYASEKIWKPFGMEADGVWLTSPEGMETGGICYSAVLRDVARFGLFILGGGTIDGKEVLAPNWIKEATTPGPAGYGYNWRINDGGKSFGHGGIMGQSLYVNPEENLVVVYNSAWRKASIPEYREMHTALLNAVIKEFNARGS